MDRPLEVLHDHVEHFNAGVRSGDFGPMLEGSGSRERTEDAADGAALVAQIFELTGELGGASGGRRHRCR